MGTHGCHLEVSIYLAVYCFFFQTVDLMVVDTKGQHFVNRENTDKGKFAFTTDDYDVFEVCFISRVPPNRRGQRHEVFLQVRGDGAKVEHLCG